MDTEIEKDNHDSDEVDDFLPHSILSPEDVEDTSDRWIVRELTRQRFPLHAIGRTQDTIILNRTKGAGVITVREPMR